MQYRLGKCYLGCEKLRARTNLTDPDCVCPCEVDGEVNGATNKREGREHKEKVKKECPALCNFRDQFSETRQAIQVTVTAA